MKAMECSRCKKEVDILTLKGYVYLCYKCLTEGVKRVSESVSMSQSLGGYKTCKVV